jgi:hypothetical protein
MLPIVDVPITLAGVLNIDSRQLRRALIQCFCRNHNTGSNDATAVLAGGSDGVKRRGRSEVHNDSGMAILVHDGDCIHDAVRADFTRIVVTESGFRHFRA